MGYKTKSEQKAFDEGQSDGAKGTREHQPNGGFIDTILHRPDRDCTNDERQAAYDAGREAGKDSRYKK